VRLGVVGENRLIIRSTNVQSGVLGNQRDTFMATIIEFYTPRSFRGHPIRVPSPWRVQVLQFRGEPADNTLMLIPPSPKLRIMFANETEHTKGRPEEITSDSPIFQIAAREGERE